MDTGYHVPEVLTILAGIFLVAGAILFIIPALDIIYRKGWRSMMWIMIPVWPINATYLGPLAVYMYFRYGRPSKPSPKDKESHTHDHGDVTHEDSGHHEHPHMSHESNMKESEDPDLESGSKHDHDQDGEAQPNHHDPSAANPDIMTGDRRHNHHDMHDNSATPFWVSVSISVMHCGAGCVLGDLVGEWLVHGTGATINGQSIWVELLVDYAFALLFGIVFQYFTIGPMAGEYGMKIVIRAIKADFLSLTSFELGLFGWMVAYQVGIWDYKLMMNSWCYWWMMQVGMMLGFVTAWPVNLFLIKKGIKEPCV